MVSIAAERRPTSLEGALPIFGVRSPRAILSATLVRAITGWVIDLATSIAAARTMIRVASAIKIDNCRSCIAGRRVSLLSILTIKPQRILGRYSHAASTFMPR